jgi:hypothetical protein
MTLTSEQKAEIDKGNAIPVVIDGAHCVVVLQDVYERCKRVIGAEMDPEEAYPAVLEAWDSAGSPQDAEDYIA